MYDAVTDTFSNYNIVTTAGSALGGAVYGDAIAFFPSDADFIGVTTNATPTGGSIIGENVLFMVLASPMTNAGGTIMVLSDDDGGFSYEGTFTDNVDGNIIERRIIGTDGTVSAVPEPSAFACLGLIVLLAGGRRWWKRRR